MTNETKPGALKDDPDYKGSKKVDNKAGRSDGKTPEVGSAAGKEGKGTGTAEGKPKR